MSKELEVVAWQPARHRASCAVFDQCPTLCDCGATSAPLVRLADAQAEIAGLKTYAATLAAERDDWARRWHELAEENRENANKLADAANDLAEAGIKLLNRSVSNREASAALALSDAIAERDALAKELASKDQLIADQNRLNLERQEWALHTNEIIRGLNAQLAEEARKYNALVERMASLKVQSESVLVPDFRGYAAMGTAQYLLYACHATKDLPPELVIVPATEEEKAGRVIGDLKECEPGLTIPPERIAIRIAFFSVAGLDALEQQLQILREESFPASITHPAPADKDGAIDVDWLSNVIRSADGNNQLGAGALAEKIVAAITREGKS